MPQWRARNHEAFQHRKNSLPLARRIVARGDLFYDAAPAGGLEFPERFGSIEDSRGFCQEFMRWYNTEHHHSGLGLLTPEVVHTLRGGEVRERRQQTLNLAGEPGCHGLYREKLADSPLCGRAHPCPQGF